MKWRGHIDYHGSRTYERDEPAVSQLSLAVAWLASAARRMFRNVLSAAAPEQSSAVLLMDGERRFSQLGTNSRRVQRDKRSDLPFPTKPTAITDHDSRVFP